MLQHFKEIKSNHFEKAKRICRKGWEDRRAFSWVYFFTLFQAHRVKILQLWTISQLWPVAWLGLKALDDSFKGPQGSQRKRIFAHSIYLEMSLRDKEHQYVPILCCKAMKELLEGLGACRTSTNKGCGLVWKYYLTDESLEEAPFRCGEKHRSLLLDSPFWVLLQSPWLNLGLNHSHESRVRPACDRHWVYPQWETNSEINISTNTHE